MAETTRKTYIQKRELGSGTYATVYLALDSETNKWVALKKIRINHTEGVPSTAIREISALKSLHHPNVIDLFEVIQSEVFLTMVFEYVQYDLKEYCTLYKFNHFILSQMISGLNYIHSKEIIHRDLKPQNILVGKDGILKIADFGLCRPMHIPIPDLSFEVVTLWYRAPELLNNKEYSYEIDIFSIGAIVFEMITGQVLLQGNDNPSQLSLIYNIIGNRHEMNRKLNMILDLTFRSVVEGCCRIERSERWQIEDLLNILQRKTF